MSSSRTAGSSSSEGKPLLDKLGVVPGSRVSVLGLRDDEFLRSLRERGADVSARRRRHSDLVFLPVDRIPAAAGFEELVGYLRPNGAVWAVFPKGRRDLREVDVIRAGVAAGLVDNKVVRFSDTHTALRFVIPRSKRV